MRGNTTRLSRLSTPSSKRARRISTGFSSVDEYISGKADDHGDRGLSEAREPGTSSKPTRSSVCSTATSPGGKAVAGEVTAKVEMMKNSIVRHRPDGPLVGVSSPVYGSVQETPDLLVRYIQAMYPVLGECLPG